MCFEVSQAQTHTQSSDSSVDKVPSMKYTLTFTNHPRKHINSHISLGAKEKGAVDKASGLGRGQIHWTICDQTLRLLFSLSHRGQNYCSADREGKTSNLKGARTNLIKHRNLFPKNPWRNRQEKLKWSEFHPPPTGRENVKDAKSTTCICS